MTQIVQLLTIHYIYPITTFLPFLSLHVTHTHTHTPITINFFLYHLRAGCRPDAPSLLNIPLCTPPPKKDIIYINWEIHIDTTATQSTDHIQILSTTLTMFPFPFWLRIPYSNTCHILVKLSLQSPSIWNISSGFQFCVLRNL